MTPEQKLGKVILAGQVDTLHPTGNQARNIILLLAASVALMMTGYGILMPVFARRFGELGGGVEALGLMTTSFALAQLVAAPFLGAMADQRGRRPFILLGLIAFALTNVGYLMAQSVALIILIRTLGGAFTSGLFPASMGVVSDIIPEDRRARWIGYIMGGYGFGFIFGPVMGGFLYDQWGYLAPFLVSAVLGGLAFVAAYVLVPETRPVTVIWREKLRKRREGETAVSAKSNRAHSKTSLWQAIPRPLTVFVTLLLIDFIGSFAFAFVEPQMVFYVYDDLGWSTTSFGLIVGCYGLALVFGQTMLGQSSDRFGRKPVIIIGILLSFCLYAGLSFLRSFGLMMITTMMAGLGSALIAPAVSAYFLDITAEQHRSRIVGVRESALALGGVLGPLLVVVVSRWTNAIGVFMIAGVLVLSGAILGMLFLRPPKPVAATLAATVEIAPSLRQNKANAALAHLIFTSSSSRGRRASLMSNQPAAD